MKLQNSLVAVFALLFFYVGHAQKMPLNFKQINSDNGLSHNTINDFLQDSRGYLWFATINGVYKFDGYTFTYYQIDHYNSEYSAAFKNETCRNQGQTLLN